jgi:acyl-CoA synthetase (AMP-forming)/AMP-acid ligase II
MKSSESDSDVCGRAANIVELLCERAERHPDRVALRYIGDGENVSHVSTYGELHRAVARVAAHLQTLSSPGDRALLLYPSGPSYVVAFLGCLYAGVVAVPAYPPESQLAHHVQRLVSIALDAQPRLLLTEQALAGTLARLAGSVDALAGSRVVATDALTSEDAEAWRMPNLGREALAFLQYTSGSTAQPKGVMVGHANLMANERVIRRAFAMNEDDIVLSWLPLFHDMGLIGTLLQPLFSGVSSVLMAPQHFMARPARWLEALSRERATVSGAPDFAYRLCAERISPEAVSGLDLSRWRLAFCGAEPVRAATLEAFARRFALAGFRESALYPCYGLAESTLLVTGGVSGRGRQLQSFNARALTERRVQPDADGRTLVGCGRVWPEHRVVIADPETGEPLPSSRIGEIQVAGPSVTDGYWKNADATGAVFVERDGQRFLRTGDLGFVQEGELFIAGRYSDRIIIRGQNLYPQDIEQSVEEHIDVLRKGRTVAFGVELEGQESIVIAAEVSQRMQKLLSVEAVTRGIAEAVSRAHGEAPRLVLLLNPGAVPITSSGKLQRRACKQAWLTGSLDTFSVQKLDRL